MRLTILAILMAIITTINAEDMQERIGLDPVLRGVWVLHATSEDGGQTIQQQPPTEVAVAAATRITLDDGSVVRIERVVIFTDPQGNPGNMVVLDNGKFLFCTKQPNNIFVLVQICEGDPVRETARWVISVQE